MWELKIISKFQGSVSLYLVFPGETTLNLTTDESTEVVDELLALTGISANKKDVSTLRMKKLVEIQDAGLQIEYRCPKCRQCGDCLKPIETEKMSLREEAELAAIFDSVQLDIANRKIICSLPLRGTEEEFLTSNKSQAVKILEQQCATYFKDEETKPVILKAFRKLFDNKHARLLKDLPPEVVENIFA